MYRKPLLIAHSPRNCVVEGRVSEGAVIGGTFPGIYSYRSSMSTKADGWSVRCATS